MLPFTFSASAAFAFSSSSSSSLGSYSSSFCVERLVEQVNPELAATSQAIPSFKALKYPKML